MKLNLYEIRLCRKEEYGKLINFIHDYWSEGHIFCRSREIFEFQHGKGEWGVYDFVIAVHKQTEEIHAVLGFITSSRYDKRSMEEPQAIYGALWKVRDDVENKEVRKLGLGVLYDLLKRYPKSSYITLGLSRYSQQIYQSIHFNFGLMEHYYMANQQIKDFRIAYAPVIRKDMVKRNDVTIVRLKDIPEIHNDLFPSKNRQYLLNRYVDHPVYQYELLGIYVKGIIKCIWVVRKITVGERKCLRLVDMVGRLDGLDGMAGNVQELLVMYDAEYIDCYNHGIEKACFLDAGFLEKTGDTIIPNYFEPFERKNVDIHYAYDGKQQVVIFKGDGDQDRPNRI